jgi:hypothetical protein
MGIDSWTLVDTMIKAADAAVLAALEIAIDKEHPCCAPATSWAGVRGPVSKQVDAALSPHIRALAESCAEDREYWVRRAGEPLRRFRSELTRPVSGAQEGGA